MLRYGQQNKKYKNRMISVGTTYLVSSLLHGLERRLSAVLLSLAAYTYVEHQMRIKLALRFPKTYSQYDNNVYCGSRKYVNNSNQSTWILWSINFIFTILNIIHLAYLGSVMDISVDNYVNKYHDSFAPWHHVWYFSHFIVFLMYIISIIL